MNIDPDLLDPALVYEEQIIEPVEFRFGLDRRAFVQVLSAGLMIVAGPLPALAQRAGGGGGRGGGFGGTPVAPAGRLQIGTDGIVTVLTGKVEMGQGSRAEITQAAAEELRVPVSQVRVIMSDTGRTPNDGLTAGSRTTPATIPAVRQAAAVARTLLAQLAAQRWSVEPGSVQVADGKATHAATQRTLTFAELAQGEDLQKALQQASTSGITLTESKDFKILGTSVPRPNAKDIVTGAHSYTSDVQRPDMMYGKVLRAPTFDVARSRFAYAAKLASVDLSAAQEMKDVIVVKDGDFVGVCAPTTFRARQALAAIAATAKWESGSHPSSQELFDYLRSHAQVPSNPFTAELAAAGRKLKQTYHVAYVQHAPMETRAAVAEWKDGQLTAWTGTQNPFGIRGELVSTFGLSEDRVRVITPDTGGGFGGKHTGECAIEAARLAKAAGKPVSLKWTREEEFTWAAFRPAAVIDIEGSLDGQGKLTSWHFVTINPGNPGMNTPYRAGRANSQAVNSQPPLRHASYRALAATANNFARECFMDELAAAAGADPLDFRLAHLEESGNSARLRAVLEEAAKRFNWRERVKQKQPDVGVGLACGTEKGSYVAACAEVAIDRRRNTLVVRRVCEAFECGTIYNPNNLLAQVQGCIAMGLGPALREEMRFADGKMQNARFSDYAVPRLSDLPELDIHLLNRPDQPAVGAGETPIIGIAPAIANAVFHATGKRVHAMPIRLSELGQA
jgi:isoquinoline 1-oxidoreductase